MVSKIYYSLFKVKFGSVLRSRGRATTTAKDEWVGIAVRNNLIREIVLPYPYKKDILKRLKRNYPDARRSNSGFGRINRELRRYFKGYKPRLSFPIDLSDFTPFERQVYRALKTVPYGEVRTYGWLAAKIGRPRSARAVGNALAKNPIPLVIPCHRIIRSNGKIGNFSGVGGPALKAKLIKMEGGIIPLY